MKPVIVFDLNGTLLDLSALDSAFERLFSDRQARKEWFAEVLKIALATTARQAYVGFERITVAALKVVEQRRDKELQDSQRLGLIQGLRRLPPFPDVPLGLEALAAAGHQLVVLTNSGLAAARGGAGGCRHHAPLCPRAVGRFSTAAQAVPGPVSDGCRSAGSGNQFPDAGGQAMPGMLLEQCRRDARPAS